MVILLVLLALLSGCSNPECALGDYAAAECRVVAENEHARLITSTGVELRFQEPDAIDASTWAALGLVREASPGAVRLRPAGLMDFAVSVDADGPDVLEVTLDNVAPDTVISVGVAGAENDLPLPADGRLSRSLNLTLGEETVWIRGRRPCPNRYRLVAAGDIQKNPLQFERIVQDLHRLQGDADAAGEPLLGFLLLGDLTERATDDEFRRIEEILVSSPVPVAVVPGNHDVFEDAYARYNLWFGPGNYAFSVCNTRVTMLDSGGGDLAPSIEARLPELLDASGHEFLVAGTHYPAYADRTGAGFRDTMQGAYLLSEAARNGIDRLMTGHVHYWAQYPAVSTGYGDVYEVISGTLGANQGAGRNHFGVTRMTFADEVTTCFDELLPPGAATLDSGGASPIAFCPAP